MSHDDIQSPSGLYDVSFPRVVDDAKIEIGLGVLAKKENGRRERFFQRAFPSHLFLVTSVDDE
jgi:hypothetical protein